MITIIPGATIITLINIYINHRLNNAHLTKKPVILSHAKNNICRIREGMFPVLEIARGQAVLPPSTWTLGLVLRQAYFYLQSRYID